MWSKNTMSIWKIIMIHNKLPSLHCEDIISSILSLYEAILETSFIKVFSCHGCTSTLSESKILCSLVILSLRKTQRCMMTENTLLSFYKIASLLYGMQRKDSQNLWPQFFKFSYKRGLPDPLQKAGKRNVHEVNGDTLKVKYWQCLSLW